MFVTWFMFSCILSIFRNEQENQNLECELLCGQILCWMRKDNLKMDFQNQDNIPLKRLSSLFVIRVFYLLLLSTSVKQPTDNFSW